MNKINDLERAKILETKYYCGMVPYVLGAHGLVGFDGNERNLDNLLDNIVSPVEYPKTPYNTDEISLIVYPENENTLRLEFNIVSRLNMNSKVKTINITYKRGQRLFLTANPDFTQTHNYCEQIPAQARALKIR